MINGSTRACYWMRRRHSFLAKDVSVTTVMKEDAAESCHNIYDTKHTVAMKIEALLERLFVCPFSWEIRRAYIDWREQNCVNICIT